MTCLEFSPDAQRLASCSKDGTIHIWKLKYGQLLGVVSVARQSIVSIAFSPEGEHIASGSDDGVLRIWSTKLIDNPNHIETAERPVEVSNFALSGDGKRILILTGEAMDSRNTLDGNLITDFTVPRGVECIAIDHPGGRAAYGTEAGAIIVWNTEQFSEAVKSWNSPELTVTQLSFSLDGTRMVYIGWERNIQIWDTATDSVVGCIEVQYYETRDVACSADGQFVVRTDDIGATKIWRTPTQELVFVKDYASAYPPGISETAAVAILRQCGPKSSYLWPRLLGRPEGDVFMERENIYCVERNNADLDLHNEKLLGILPSGSGDRWELSTLQGIFLTVVLGGLVLCRLIK